MYLYTSVQTRFNVMSTNQPHIPVVRPGRRHCEFASHNGDKNLLVLSDEQSTMLRGGRGSRYTYRLTVGYIPRQCCTTSTKSHTSLSYVSNFSSTSELAAKTQPWTMEAEAKQGPKSLVALEMGGKPRHGANVVLGSRTRSGSSCALLQDLPLMPRWLLLAVHQLDIRFILLCWGDDSWKN